MMNSNICERINKLKEEIQKRKFTIEDVILENIPQDTSRKDVFEKVFFDIVVREETDVQSEYESYKSMSMFFLRCIGGIIEKGLAEDGSPKKQVKKVYCVIGISGMKVDDTYLQCIINEYYKVISAWTSTVINVAGIGEDFKVSDILRTMQTDIAEFYHKIPIDFRKYMLELYGIDIDVIIGLSGSYYEGGQCNSGIFLEMSSDEPREDEQAVRLEEPIEVNRKNIRKIRKLLEMGNEGQYLMARKKGDACWKIMGLYNKDSVHRGITFRIIRHMVWYMEMARKKTVYYKCGEYVIECDEFRRSEFKRKYTDVFGQECNEKLMKVFEGAIRQEHGTIAVILDDSNVYEELNRLMENSTGIKIHKTEFDTEYIHRITSIDGAVVFDASGICYAIGVILDSRISVKGQSERGARFNSALKYVETCRESGINALVMVVSEDKTINILSTAE